MTIQLVLQRADDAVRNRFASLQTREDVADLLEIPDGYLKSILYFQHEPLRYRSFTIPKRNGGVRIISAPPPNLSILQSKLNHVFQLVYAKKKPAQGFVRGRSILTNAAPHAGKKWVLNVDLKDFFPSINFGRVRGMLMARPYGLAEAPATVIAQICCADNALPQGAPSSPMLANMVCGRLDGELFALARRHRVAYTRYGDDLSFSTRAFTFPTELATATGGWIGDNVLVGHELASIIEANGFELNPSKTRLQFKDCHQEVTGMTVNQFPNVSRALVREVRAMLHAWERYGYKAAEDRFAERYDGRHRRSGIVPSFRNVVKGKVAFIKMVRGLRDPVYCRLRAHLHRLDPTLIGPAPTPLPRLEGSVAGVGADPGWTRWYRQLGDRVFQLEVNMEGAVHSGTAFALRRTTLATAAHNVRGRVIIHVRGTSSVVTEVIPHARYRDGVDCALLLHDHGGEAVSIDQRVPEPGEAIAVIGFASVPRRKASLGIYAGHVESVNVDYAGSITYIQISVDAAGGLSGSPVIDRSGRVFGLVIESTYEQTNAGVPGREFVTVLPIRYVTAIDPRSPTQAVPLP